MASSQTKSDVAVVGMACVFPGAPDLAGFWANICDGVDAISDVPATRWDEVFYDPTSSDVDRFYCRRGGFIDDFARFDALRFGIMPVAAKGCEPDQLMTLQVAYDALADAGYEDRDFARQRAGVVIGRGNYIGAGMTRLEQHVRTSEQLVTSLKAIIPGLDDAQLQQVKRAFQSELGSYGPDTAIGLVPNLTASRIANRLDLQGAAYTVDAACASSLLALDQACRDLVTHRSDLVLAGGVHLSHDVAFWSVFCQLGALSRSQQIRPFDQRADGILIGEGLGIAVLKRREDAERDGDRIYAVIHGTGVSSDGKETSLMIPRVDGQVLALEQAWKTAGHDPGDVGLIEAHGTGTPAGDGAELSTLARVFGRPEGEKNGSAPGLGAVKSMIGHAMPAAGMAGFIKAVMAVHHGVLPPTLHCDEPNPLLDETRFRLISQTEEWPGDTRLAGVNAFGFGGINGHVVVGAHPSALKPASRRRPSTGTGETLAVFAAASQDALLEALDAKHYGGSGPHRLVVFDPSVTLLAKARDVVSRGKPHRGRGGIWYSPDGVLLGDGKIAFVFPGVEGKEAPQLNDVAAAFGAEPLSRPDDMDPLEAMGVSVVSAGRLLHKALTSLGITPDVIAGHSIGEWTGMIASGMIADTAVDAFVETLVPGSLEVPGVAFLAAGCGAEKALAAIAGLDDIALSHDNCPHQVILCGKHEQVALAHERLKDQKVLCQVLPFRSGFHSPLFDAFVAPHRGHFESIALQPPKTPLWSATLAAPYPDDEADVRALAIDHLVQPIQFRRLLDALYDDGVRAFVQLGDGAVSGFVSDTLRGRPHLSVSAASSKRDGMGQLRHAAAALFVEGADIDLFSIPGTAQPAVDRSMPLQLGVPLIQMRSPLPTLSAPSGSPVMALPNEAADPVIAEYNAAMRDVADVQREVFEVWQAGRSEETPAPQTATNAVQCPHHLSVESFPELKDHCFFRQADEWPHLEDWYPVVPMTMSVQMMLEAAETLYPDLVAVEVTHVRAYRWLAVSPPVDVVVEASGDSPERVQVAVRDDDGNGYIECVVQMAATYEPPPEFERETLDGERPAEASADSLYSDRWMFHGPSYQGVKALSAVGDNGIYGTLTVCPGKGGLLDNAGQLLGYWVMAMTSVDRLAMPVTIDRMVMFGPHPDTGEELECDVSIVRLGNQRVRSNMTLHRKGAIWAIIEGWTDQRFQTDERLWPLIQFADRNVLSERRPGGYALAGHIFETGPSIDYFRRRYLTAVEREAYEQVGERNQLAWLYGRIAAKDAARSWLWENGCGDLFPAEVRVENEVTGRPVMHVTTGHDLRVSIAHKADIAVAMVREGRPVGIDIDQIEARAPGFVDAFLSADEQALLPADGRDEWVIRFWCAKEAVGKARGTGLDGAPKRLAISMVDGERIQVDGQWVLTTLEQRGADLRYVVAFTEEPVGD